MQDLRKDYNVSHGESGNKKSIWSKVNNNQNIIKLLVSSILISFVIFKPHIIGNYVGKWFSSLTEPFLSNVTMTSNEWYVILITMFSVTVCYTLIKWVNNN